MTDIPTTEPEKITAGDYVTWKKKSGDCVNPSGTELKASDSWTLTYALVKDGKQITITANASGDDFMVTLAAATTAAYKPGFYHWQAYCTGGSSERYMVDSGTIEILPNLADESTGYDNRSHVKKVLDAIEATVQNRASSDQAGMVVGGEVVGHIPLHRLLELKRTYEGYYRDEVRTERLANGQGHESNIYVRFVDP